MWQYLLYFLIGGSVVALVAFLANQGNQLLAVIAGNLPVMFIFNTFLLCRIGGTTNAIAYARGSLLLLPFFILFVITMMMLLPRTNATLAALVAMLAYVAPSVAFYKRRQRLLQANEIIDKAEQTGNR